MPFEVTNLSLAGIKLVQPKVFHDERGFFLETYKRSEFVAMGIHEEFVQDNYSCSEKNVLRGLHYQLEPFAQGKLVSVLSGAIFDVVVDIRPDSPTFKQWLSVLLSADEKKMLWVPTGFAHGFLSLADDTKVYYKVTAEYSPAHERGLRWDDAELNITWPLRAPPFVAPRDEAWSY